MTICSFKTLLHLIGDRTHHQLNDFGLNYLRVDSREVQKNDVFIAIKGLAADGRDFIPQAINNGASAVLIETDDHSNDLKMNYITQGDRQIPQIQVFNLSERLSVIASDFYNSPSKKLSVIGVTGTNGKTTVTQLIAQLSKLLHQKSAILGTIGNGIYPNLTPSINTTSSAVDVQTFLADFATQNVQVVAMEISSHGLVMNRVKGLSCVATVFTNLSRDHLDYHQSMDNYEKAKWSLFAADSTEKLVNNSGKPIINYDDEYGKRWVKKLNNPTIVSIQPDLLPDLKKSKLPYLGASKVDYHHRGATIHIDSIWGKAIIHSQLLGEFNVSNLLLTLATLLTLDFPFAAVTDNATHLTPICGRMEVLHSNDNPTVIVDYAHTPDALQKALQACRIHCSSLLWVVFGCGGDRDSGKRPLMGQIAEHYADKIILTNDNPRTENEMMIIDDIKKGITDSGNVQIIPDRAKAIEQVLNQANANDVILIAGKGHEDYQIIGNTKHHYSDQETVKKQLKIESKV